MDDQETRDLTLVMVDSGHKVDLSSIPGRKVDKHSTGGVGDTTSLLIGPIVAAAGVPFAKMSGRGLGHTGGTLDKLEAIPGYRINLTEKEFVEQVKRIGCSIISPTGDLAPADKKMYALRDVTATVDNIPLIAGSIMSKKLAAGADVILLDVKMGCGAFMTNLDDARALARALVTIGNLAGKETRAVITDMNQPLSSHIGNALEVKEVFELLREGSRSSHLRDVTLELCGHLFVMAGLYTELAGARARAEEILVSGAALRKMGEMIEAQGGNKDVLSDLDLLPKAPIVEEFGAPQSGSLLSIDVCRLGLIARDMGAGRIRKEDAIDPSVGLVLHKRMGDIIEKGEPFVQIHAAKAEHIAHVKEQLAECFTFETQPVTAPPLILDVVI